MERPVPLRRSLLLNNGKTRGKRGETEEGGDPSKKKSKKKKADKPEPEVAPEFVVKPRRQFIDDGAVAKFKASFDGPSSTQLYWSKDGNVLIPDDHYKIYEADGFHHLEVLNVTSKDNGEFTVTALNAAGSDTATAELEVFEKPKLLTTQMPEWEKPLEDLVVREGDTAVEITCSSKDLKNPTVKWFLNDKELTSGFHTQLQHEGQLVKLTIKEIRESDAGQIKCVMTGTNGELESACAVTVRPPEKMEAPVFVKELHDMEVEEGDKLELDVRVKGTPPVDVFWFHNNVAITRDSPHFLLASLGQSVHTLTLPRASRECSGEFVCEAYNAFGDTDTFCLVHVREVEDPEPPSFVTRPVTLIAQEGESVTLTCRVRGQPAPTVLWERQGVMISSCEKYQTANHDDNHSLTIDQLESSDAGLYVCHLHSATGDASHTCELRVEESQRRARAFLSKSLREPLDLNSLGPGIESAQGSRDGRQKHSPSTARPGYNKGANSHLISNQGDQELPDFVKEHRASRSSESSNSSDTVKGPPTPKPRTLKNGSQSSPVAASREAKKADESFVFPSLKPVTNSNAGDKNRSDSGPPQRDFRSVLRPRSQVLTTQSKLTAESETATDFRSVLSKPKPTDRDPTLTAGGFPRSDPVGLELRNLQMTRTSRNVASSRSGEPKFGVGSLVGFRESASSGASSHRELSYNKPSSHVNNAGLRIVSKNLGTLDSWDSQQSNSELPLSARGGREWNSAGPSYSPSSCASVSHQPQSESSPLQGSDAVSGQSAEIDQHQENDCSSFRSNQTPSTKAVPRFQSSNQNVIASFNGSGGQTETVSDSSIPTTSVGAQLRSVESRAKVGETFIVTGVSSSSKGSITLAAQKGFCHEGSISMPEPNSTSVSSNLLKSETTNDNSTNNLLDVPHSINPENTPGNQQQQQEEDTPPPLPSSRPPSLPSSEPPEPKDQDQANSAKCVSSLQFTPSSLPSASSDSSTPLQPVVFNFTLPDSSSSRNLKPTSQPDSSSSPKLERTSQPYSSSSPKLERTSQQQGVVCVEETPGISDSSRDDSVDDVFTDHIEVTQEERRGSMKAAGSVFAWEKYSTKSPETSPFGEGPVNTSEIRSSGSRQATKKKTCFNLDTESSGHPHDNQSKRPNPVANSYSKSLSSSSPKTPPSSSKSKPVSSGSPDAEFTKIKLKSTGIKGGPGNDLKKSKFLSTSSESLFFDVKLKPVAIKDPDDDTPEPASLAKNSWSIKAKSKSSGDLLRETRGERWSGNNGETHSAKETAGFSEKRSVFENRGSVTDRTGSLTKPNFTIPKRNTVSRTANEANKRESEKSSNVPLTGQNLRNNSNINASKVGTKFSDVQQPKLSSTLPRQHNAPGSRTNEVESKNNLTKPRYHSADMTSSRMETVPTWVKEKAFGKRSSLTVDSKAATLPMSSNTGSIVQNTRDRITKLKENPDAPKTPRRFKRDKPGPEDQLSSTLGNGSPPYSSAGKNTSAEPKTVLRKTSDAIIKPNRDLVNPKASKPWQKSDSNTSVPEWAQRRNLKPVGPSSNTEQASKQPETNRLSKELPSKPRVNDTSKTPFSSLVSRFNKAPTSTTSPEISAAAPITKVGTRQADLNSEPKKDNFSNVVEKTVMPSDTVSNVTPQTVTPKQSNNQEKVKPAAMPDQVSSNSVNGASTSIAMERPNLASSTTTDTPKNLTSDLKLKDDFKQVADNENSVTTERQPARTETPVSSRLSGAKQAPSTDSSAINNQPSLRNTSVRPAWKKQRSLRHIPIYPIHDNELSPRYEPFVDDTESIASISSTSSEASNVTSDSGYHSRSRANTTELNPHLTKDHQQHNLDDAHAYIKQEEGASTEGKRHPEEEGKDDNMTRKTDDKPNLPGGKDDHQSFHQEADEDDGFHQEDILPSQLINKDPSVIQHPTLHKSHLEESSYTSIGETQPGEGIENSLPSSNSEGKPNDTEAAKDAAEFKKDISTDERVVGSLPSPDTSKTHLFSDKPTRQSLNLKNKVSYLDDSEEKLDTGSEPITFPRRRSKFMDNYMNGRRGSDDVSLEGAEKPDGDAPFPKPIAKRPADLDIVPKWKRSQPVPATKVEDQSNSNRDSSTSDRTRSRHNLLESSKDVPTEPAHGLAGDGVPEIRCSPAFTKPLEETMEVVYGSKAILSCRVSGDPYPDVEWLRDRKLIQPSRTVGVSREGEKAKLTLTETFAENEGVYTCRVSNSEGSAESSCVLRLAASEKSEGGRAFEGPVSLPPRVITLTPKVVSLPVGSPLTLTATFAGEPSPSVKWILAGREIVPDERIHLENQRGTSTLTIDALQRSEVGKMSVCVSSSIGTDQSSVNICIEDVPHAPIGKPQVYDLGRASASLSWCGPASSGGNNVTHYSIEARTRQNGPTWDVVVSQCKELTCHILDLKPCTTYQFRVRAANRHGLGPPSEPSDRVTTFDPFTSPSDYESDGFNEVFTPSIVYREDELPFEPRHVTFNTEEKFESVYDLDKEVGKGKFGTVYKCRHKKDGTTWAAKVVKCRPRDKAALRMEVDVMNKLRHPKLLMLWDAFESDRQMVLVMEYVGAGELFERVIGEDFVLTERDCIHFLRQICEGMDYMHRQCVLHLDLKPENILCLSENSNRIKIIDFGLARHHTPGESMKVLFGTPEFIAPEVINYDEIGFATDMWSIGVICYVLLSGLSPFLGDSDTETLSMVTTGEFDFDDEAFDEISDQAKDFISKLLVKRKEKRMLTTDCMKHDWLNQDEVDGARYKRLNTDRLKRFMVRRKWLKTGNAVKAVSRLLKSTSILSRLGSMGSSQSTSEENLLETPTDPSGPTFVESITESSPESSKGANSGSPAADPSATSSSKCDLSHSARESDSNNNSNNGTRNTSNVMEESLPDPNMQSDSHNSGPNPSTSSQLTESSLSRTSSLASPLDIHQHPSGLGFTKTMANCKACKGDAARFDIAISGASLPLRLDASRNEKSTTSENSSESEELLVSWYFDGEQIAQDGHYQMNATSSSSGNFSLIIRSVCEEDEGEYLCKVCNSSSGEEVLLCCRGDLSVLNV